ncbi:MAG: hypothetical protein LBI43_04780, partial [Streptococcaceae bacterium]|nr:hypothetical protein [Streptococcaceae bacterium]
MCISQCALSGSPSKTKARPDDGINWENRREIKLVESNAIRNKVGFDFLVRNLGDIYERKSQ